MFLRLIPTVLTVFIIMVFIGCSSGNSPVTLPGHNSGAVMPNAIPVGVTDRFSDGSPASGMGALGVFNLKVDAIALTAEMIPLRNTALTDVLEVVDIYNFLQIAPCTDCVKIGSISLDMDGNLVISIGIKHPFPAGDPISPITGKNRGDLHVFNIEGTIISTAAGTSFTGLSQTSSRFALVNADGYSGYLDDALDEIYPTDATIHPYILHFDDYTEGNFDASNPMGFANVTNPGPSGNLVMAMGCDYDYQDYVFNLDGGYLDFFFTVGCTYAVSAGSKSERFSPEFRIPQHNKKAASEVSVEIITNMLSPGSTASTADIEIHVVDVSHGVAVGEELDRMFADSSVGGITLEVPGVELSIVAVDVSSPTGTGHDPSDPLIYTATITNTAGGGENVYTGLVKVTDAYSPGLNELPLLNGMDGIERVDPSASPLTGLFDISEFATYAVFEITVEQLNESPVAILEPNPVMINVNGYIIFDATNSYDTDGTIDTYEFDFNWDGIEANFTTDVSNATGTAVSLSDSYIAVGSFYAGLRVTDDFGGIAYDTVDVTVCDDEILSWDTSLPEMVIGHQLSANMVIDDQLWIVGGQTAMSLEVFDLATETWDLTPRAPIPDGRRNMAGAYYDGKIYVIGGYYSSPFTRLNTTMIYDIGTNTWDTTTVPVFINPARHCPSAVAYQDKIYFAYGLRDSYPYPSKYLDIYTPATNSWSIGAEAPTGRANPFFVIVGDRIYAGATNNPLAGGSEIEYYEPATDTWTIVGTMARHRGAPGAVAVGTKIYVVGGIWTGDNAYNWMDVYETQTNTWTQLMDLPEDRGCLPACAYYDCKLYIAGGRGDSGPNYKTIIAGVF